MKSNQLSTGLIVWFGINLRATWVKLTNAMMVLLAATTFVFHDAAGRVTGKARTENGVTTYYDAAGRVTGKAVEKR